jgi:hypothetical protein
MFNYIEWHYRLRRRRYWVICGRGRFPGGDIIETIWIWGFEAASPYKIAPQMNDIYDQTDHNAKIDQNTNTKEIQLDGWEDTVVVADAERLFMAVFQHGRIVVQFGIVMAGQTLKA